MKENFESYMSKAIEMGVKNSTASGLAWYITAGDEPGGFLKAVLSNDLMNAFGRADTGNSFSMQNIVSFLYNVAPIGCHGSEEKMIRWIKKGGLNG